MLTRINTTFREVTTTNTSLAFAADCIGIDQHQLSMFCGIIDLPGPPDSYTSYHQDVIFKALTEQIDERLQNKLSTFIQQCFFYV